MTETVDPFPSTDLRLGAFACIRRFGLVAYSVLAALALVLVLSPRSLAANHDVTNLNDSGAGSLRAALAAAAGGDTITFDAALSGTVTLASTLPEMPSLTFVNAEDITLSYTSTSDAIEHVLRTAGGETLSGTLPNMVFNNTEYGAINLLAWGDLTLANEFTGSMTSQAVSGADGIVVLQNLTMGDYSGVISLTSTERGTVRGFYADGGDISINNFLASGRITLNAANTAYAIRASNNLSMGNLAGIIDITAGGDGYGLNTETGNISVNNITGTLDIKATRNTAYGIYSANNLSINSISGTIDTESTDGTAYGLLTRGTLDNGAGAAIDISGTVTAQGNNGAYGIYAEDGMKLNIAGTVSASTSSGTAYAISGRTGTNFDDTVSLANGAQITGDINLYGGTNTLTMDGAGTLDGAASNITTLTKSGAGTWDTSGIISTQDLDMQAGVLDVEINQTNSPSVDASGTITNNGEVRFSIEGSVAPGTHTILSAANPLAGGGTYTLSSNSIFLAMTQNANSITLTKDAYADVASGVTPNGQTMAAALDSNADGATGDFATILQQLDSSSSTAELGECVGQLTGLDVESMSGMSADTARMFSSAAGTRMAEVRTYQIMMADKGEPDPNDPESWPMVAANGDLAGILHRQPDFKPNGVHLRALGRSGDMDSHGGYSGYDYNTFALSGGYDHMLDDGFLMGVFGGYARTYADYKDAAGSESKLESYTLGLYATWFKDDWYVDASLSRAYNKYDITRPIPFLGRTATSDPTGYTVSAKASAGQRYIVGDYGLTPTASLEYTVFYQDEYTESGAGAANLSVESISSKFLDSGIGGKIDRSWDTDFGRIIPEISAMWMHEWLTQNRSLSVNMTGMPGTAIPQTTAEAANDALRLGAGLRAIHNDGLSLTLRYQAEMEEHASSHSLMFETQILF